MTRIGIPSLAALLFAACCAFSLAYPAGNKAKASSGATPVASTNAASATSTNTAAAATTSEGKKGTKGDRSDAAKKSKIADIKARAQKATGVMTELDVHARKLTLDGKTYAVAPLCKIYTLEADGNAYLSSVEKGSELRIAFTMEGDVPTIWTMYTKEAAAAKDMGAVSEPEKAPARGKKK